MKKKIDYLVLLIGTNPLPNYVVSDLFLQNSKIKKIYLLHSIQEGNQQATCKQAKNLKSLLKIEKNFTDVTLVPINDASSATYIYNDIKDTFDELIEKHEEKEIYIHLNYTGGTKAMSIHVYNYFKQKEYDNFKHSVYIDYSYLDARSFRLINDDNQIVYHDNSENSDLRKMVKLDFKDLVELHGFEIMDNSNKSVPDTKNICEAFQNLIDKDQINDFYEFFNKRKILEKIEKLNTLIEDQNFYSLFYNLPKDFALIKDGKPDKELFKNNIGKAYHFLNGIWLEYHIKNILTKAFNEEYINISMDQKIKQKDWNSKSYFQIDIVLLIGYHLVGISCTRSKDKMSCKRKGFEIILRTTQIGGDEAKAIIITFANSKRVKTLQDELKHETGDMISNILVLGIEDLKQNKLIEKIEEFILQD